MEVQGTLWKFTFKITKERIENSFPNLLIQKIWKMLCWEMRIVFVLLR